MKDKFSYTSNYTGKEIKLILYFVSYINIYITKIMPSRLNDAVLSDASILSSDEEK